MPKSYDDYPESFKENSMKQVTRHFESFLAFKKPEQYKQTSVIAA